MAVRELVAQPQEEMLAAREICILTEPGGEVWSCRCHVMLERHQIQRTQSCEPGLIPVGIRLDRPDGSAERRCNGTGVRT